MTLAQCITAFKGLQDGKRALWDVGYHKSKREHWGIKAPDLDPIVKTIVRQSDESELLSLAKQLWETNVFDLMIAAARILSVKKIKGGRKVWLMLKNFMKDVDGWALEDTLARSAWKCIEEDPKILNELEKWTKHENFWWRRAALIFTLPFAKPGRDPERMLKWASGYAADREWFIQKAIGWWLRDLGSHNPKRVMKFLEQHWIQLQYVAKKESTRKLDNKYLKKIHQLAL